MTNQRAIHVCESDELREGEYRKLEVIYAGESSSVVVFRFKGRPFAFRNLCVHMPRTLDCERDMIFDDGGNNLRCSMHGITYDPVTGESLSEICRGKKLTPIKLYEDESGVWLRDKRIKLSKP